MQELLHKSVHREDAKSHAQYHQHINQPATNISYLFYQMASFFK